MSGGTFNYNQYILTEIAEELEEIISKNDDPGSPDYSTSTLMFFKEVAQELKKLREKIDAIDKVIACDTSEDDLRIKYYNSMGQAEGN
jgi:uncharacterized protein (DUF1697 family)